jgi:formylglycine-generating enzyme
MFFKLMKNAPLSIKHNFLLKFCAFASVLVFSFCKNEKSTLVLTSTITVVQDTFGQIAMRQIPTFDTLFKGMVVVKGGYAFVGSDSNGLQVENPRFWIHVQPFLMDESPVTVGQFRVFVRATGYKTEAEGFGNGGFIDETSQNTWILKDGCTWEKPYVSWNDAQAYSKWAGKRLPHELEFEYAARNARNDQTLYSIGNDLKTADGKWRVNIWQGVFPYKNELTDGHKFASPVGTFGKTPLGLMDMTGNVWQWCENGKFNYVDVLEALKNGGKITEVVAEKAQRGGSFLCEATWCHGYRVSGRSFTSPETSLLHVGFRCVKDF